MKNNRINPTAVTYVRRIEEISKEKKPLVAIQCFTYNHEKYLRDALEGFVMQKTDFPFVAIVHDDASTDNTTNIIREYADKYPDIILPIYEKENQYSLQDGSLRKIMDKACEVTRAKYIAMCEGDDYWTDPTKLQLQVDFLRVHPNTSLCFHPVKVLTEGKPLINPLFRHLREGYFTADTIISKWTIPTCSALFTQESYTDLPYDSRFNVGDNVVWMNCCKHGKAYCINKQMGVYRRNLSGWVRSTFTSDKKMVLNQYKLTINHLDALLYHFPNIGINGIKKKLSDYYARVFILSLLYERKSSKQWLIKGLNRFGITFTIIVIQRANIYIKNQLIFLARKYINK